MFNSKLKDKIYDLECKIRDLEHERDRYKEARDYFADESFNLQRKAYDSAINSEMQVDFEKMDAFSIERVYTDKNGAYTVIGHRHKGAELEVKIKEWSLYCNQATHDRLVKEFNNYMSYSKSAKEKK